MEQKSEISQRVTEVSRTSEFMAWMKARTVTNLSPQEENHEQFKNHLISLGYSSGSIAISANTGQINLGGGKKVEWLVDISGEIQQITATQSANEVVTFAPVKNMNGDVTMLTASRVDMPTVVMVEADEDATGKLLGYWDRISDIYYPIGTTAPLAEVRAGVVSLDPFRSCMRGCNETGRDCTSDAKRDAARKGRDATIAYGGLVVGATVTGALVGSGAGAVAGAFGSVIGGGVIWGLTMMAIREDLQADLNECREDYDRCVRGCRLLLPDDNASAEVCTP